ncbi:MAG: UPF0182 family protein [Actinomycetota bacterium]|nr:UPF0182 family protein [Actinomycetota bacterium]
MFTRVPSDSYRSDRRRPVTVILAIAGAIYLLLTAAGTLWTDFLWFDSIGFRNVWVRNWSLSVLLGVVGIGVAFLVLWLSLALVDRLSPRWAPFDLSEEEELIERFREWIEPRVRQIRTIVTAGLSLILGLAVATWRDEVFLFINDQDFGQAEPIFNVDIGFYVFRLPLWESAVDWVFNLLVLAIVVVAIAHYLNGGIRFDGRRLSSTRGAKIHLSSMLAVIALVRAAAYRLDMFELLYSDSAGKFFGPGFTDINARLPALRLLLIIALVAAALFIANIFMRNWTLAGVSVASWIVVAIAAGTIYPAVIQRFNVLPNQLQKEMPYITNNLEMTRSAYQLDEIEVRPFSASDELTAEDIEANALTIDNLRIWSTSVLPRTYQNFQELEPYYALSKVDTDRYPENGEPRQVMIAVRELEELNLPRDDWQNTRLFYTHGFGAVVNQANVVQSDGQPRFLLKDIPPVASVPGLELIEPRVYFGETYQPGRPVIVKTGEKAQEIDIPLAEGTQFNEYEGEAGVHIDNIWKRIAFAFRYRDLNLLISGEIRDDSRVLVERNVREIVDNVAPFLESDADPYPVILDGNIKWVLDLYTTTSYYPYSQPLTRAALGRLNVTSDLGLGTNYLRNSVKAVIDANNGDVTFYLHDSQDPIARAWSAAYPGIFEDISAMPEGLEDHLRYPQDLFRLQSQIYLEYHVTDVNQLFSGNDAWSFPADPSSINRTGSESLIGDSRVLGETSVRLLREVLPYYLLTELPGEEDLSYLLLQPFNPLDKRNMVGFMVADSTPGRYGRLIDYRMPQGKLVDGTEQVGQRIEQDAEISQQLSLWRGDGSVVILGDLFVVPIEDSVLYFQPIYLEEEGGAFPEFRRVAVVFGNKVRWADSLDGALELVFGESDGGGAGEVEPPAPGDANLEELIASANEAFANADAALRAGDLADYQQWVEEAARILGEIEQLVNESTDASAFRPT